MLRDMFLMITISSIVMIFIIIIAIIANYYTAYQCDNYKKITGIETRYANFDNCYIKTDSGKFERWDAYKARIIAKDSLIGKEK